MATVRGAEAAARAAAVKVTAAGEAARAEAALVVVPMATDT